MKGILLKMSRRLSSIGCCQNMTPQTPPWTKNQMIATTNGENDVNVRTPDEIHGKNGDLKYSGLGENDHPKKESFRLKSKNSRRN
jgi:hypothetical protein